MMRTLNTAATGMYAQQTNLDTIANNLSNVNTNGFKSQRAEFQDLMYQTTKVAGANNGNSQIQPISLQVGMGTRFSATGTDLAQGPSQATNNPLDLAINGSGYFQVERPDGTLAYTRDGSFRADENGLVVTTDGMPLSPKLTLPAQYSSLQISPDGIVSCVKAGETNATQVGQIGISTFSNPAGLQRIGQNQYTATLASGSSVPVNPGTSGSGSLQSGYLEGSNVQVVDEMVKMISAQRAYEINSKAITTADDMLSIVNGMKR
jgi:flagellar basal-body rod protein FlgG